jgi:hypothetical protein
VEKGDRSAAPFGPEDAELAARPRADEEVGLAKIAEARVDGGQRKSRDDAPVGENLSPKSGRRPGREGETAKGLSSRRTMVWMAEQGATDPASRMISWAKEAGPASTRT